MAATDGRESSWATEAEITAAANIYQVDILVRIQAIRGPEFL
jgi:hypothetical protein